MTHSTTPTKTCTKCDKEFPATAEYFYRAKRGKNGLKAQCKSCQRAYHESNREREREYRRIYYAANRERKKECDRRRRLTNPEGERERLRAWRAANPERAREQTRAQRKANPERTRAIKLKRRAREHNADGTHTAEDIQCQYKNQRGRCYYCQAKVGDDYHLDHVIPLSRGGSNDLSNLVIACPTCNQSKGARLPSEWPEGGRLL